MHFCKSYLTGYKNLSGSKIQDISKTLRQNKKLQFLKQACVKSFPFQKLSDKTRDHAERILCTCIESLATEENHIQVANPRGGAAELQIFLRKGILRVGPCRILRDDNSSLALSCFKNVISILVGAPQIKETKQCRCLEPNFICFNCWLYRSLHDHYHLITLFYGIYSKQQLNHQSLMQPSLSWSAVLSALATLSPLVPILLSNWWKEWGEGLFMQPSFSLYWMFLRKIPQTWLVSFQISQTRILCKFLTCKMEQAYLSIRLNLKLQCTV